MDRGADISDCGKYRYRLWRWWDDRKPLVNFIMLNPSTADADTDDPTIQKCMKLARNWGHGGIMVTNLFAYRTPHPRVLRAFKGDRVGKDNHDFVFDEARACVRAIAAWGNGGTIESAGASMREELQSRRIPLYHLGLTRFRQPKHPLARGNHRVPDDMKPRPWRR